MSKLLISCATLGHGGAERVLSILSHSFADNFDEIIYLMWLKGNMFYKIDPRVRLISLPDYSGYNNRYREILAFRKIVKKEKPDLVLSFLTPFNMLVQLATVGLQIKVVVCERNDPHYVPGGKIMEKLRDFTYRWSYGILTQTDYSKKCYKGKLGEKATVIYNPVMMNREEVGSALLKEKSKRIITVGRLHPQKNQRMLIDSFAIFFKDHPTYELVIFGEGPLKQELIHYVEQRGLSKVVKFMGQSDNVWEEIKVSKMFVLSSIAEGMSNALIEAMCLGVPVISTKVAGAVDLIKDGENGYLIDLKDVKGMSQRMSQIADNEALANQLGTIAAKVYELLNEQTISKRWIDYIWNTIK